MRSPDQLVAAFRASGRKVTLQRERIFRILHESTTHPTADSVHAELVADMPSVSLKTVYSTLHELAEMGELRQIELGTGSARFDPTTDDHHHLVCDHCGAVRDVAADFSDVTLPPGGRFGFEVERTQIVFRGRCARCAAGDAAPQIPYQPNPHEEQHPHA